MISSEKLAFIVAKAKQYEAQMPVVDPNSGSNPTDDGAVDVLEAGDANLTSAELQGALAELNSDEKDEVLAMVWLGRGDFSREEWPDVLAQAREERARGDTAALLQVPLLAEYLEAAAAELEIPLEAVDSLM